MYPHEIVVQEMQGHGPTECPSDVGSQPAFKIKMRRRASEGFACVHLQSQRTCRRPWIATAALSRAIPRVAVPQRPLEYRHVRHLVGPFWSSD